MGIREEVRQSRIQSVSAISVDAPDKFARKAAQRQFPQREDSGVCNPDIATLGQSGVLVDADGKPYFDTNQEINIRATGLGDDHGIYHEMLLSDPTVSGVTDMISREITRAKLRVVEPDNPTPLEREAFRLAQRFFGLDGTLGWLANGTRQLIYQACQAIHYGFSVCEVSWQEHAWRGSSVLAPSRIDWRAPWSIAKLLWHRDRLVGIEQIIGNELVKYSISGTPSRNSQTPTSYSSVTIPANKLIWFTHNAITGNPLGRSIMRSAYRYVQLKQRTLARIEMAEASLGNGVTTIKELINPSTGQVYDQVSDEDFQTAVELAELRANGEVGVQLEPAGIEVNTEWPTYSLTDRSSYLEWLTRQILMALSASILGLDSSHAGSSSLSGTFGQVLYNAIEGLALEVFEPINGTASQDTLGLIPALINANLRVHDGFRYPRLVPDAISLQDHGALVDMLSKALQFRLIEPSEGLSSWLSDVIGIPNIKTASASADAPRLSEEGTQAPQSGPAVGQDIGQEQ